MKRKLKINSLGLTVYDYQTVNKLWTKHELFGSRIQATRTITKLVIEKITPLMGGRIHTPSEGTNGRYHVSIANLGLTPGFYPFDQEESTDDRLVCYMEDKLNEATV